MIPYFEAHIALNPENLDAAKSLGSRYGFWVSVIQGDDLLGPGKKVYLTKRGDSAETLIQEVRLMCEALAPTKWLRRKVEVAIFDEVMP